MASVSDSLSCTSKKRPSPHYEHDSLHSHKRLHQANHLAPSSHPDHTTLIPSTTHPSRLDALQREMKMLFELEYQDEVVEFMHEMDARTRPSVETIDLQPELQWYMRPYLMDFLIEIHQQYRLRPETLYLAINIIDRYVSKRVVFKKHYQLVGCSALWIAAKFEDSKDRVPTVNELNKMCCGAYEESSFIQMEGHVLSTIDWKLGHPTCEAWLRLYSIGAHRSSPKLNQIRDSHGSSLGLESPITGNVARFIMELSLFHRSYVGLRSAHIAAAALILSRFILGQPRRLEDESKEIMAVVRLLDAHLGDHLATVSAVVIKKYSHGHSSRASALVKEWYERGERFRAIDEYVQTVTCLKPTHASSQASTSAPGFSEQQRSRINLNVSLSSSTSHPNHPHLTPSSISSLSLDSSPTSSVSSFMSSSISSTCSPQSSRSSSILIESKVDKDAIKLVDDMGDHLQQQRFSSRTRTLDHQGDKENVSLRSVRMVRDA